MSYGGVWFKRDLRLHDHAALNQALAAGPVQSMTSGPPGYRIKSGMTISKIYRVANFKAYANTNLEGSS